MSKNAGAIPLSNELIELVKKRQLKMSNDKGKIVTLTEVSNEIVKKGLELITKENEMKEINKKITSNNY